MTTTTLAADTVTADAATPARARRATMSCLRWGLAQRAGAAALAGAGLWTAVLWALGGAA